MHFAIEQKGKQNSSQRGMSKEQNTSGSIKNKVVVKSGRQGGQIGGRGGKDSAGVGGNTDGNDVKGVTVGVKGGAIATGGTGGNIRGGSSKGGRKVPGGNKRGPANKGGNRAGGQVANRSGGAAAKTEGQSEAQRIASRSLGKNNNPGKGKTIEGGSRQQVSPDVTAPPKGQQKTVRALLAARKGNQRPRQQLQQSRGVTGQDSSALQGSGRGVGLGTIMETQQTSGSAVVEAVETVGRWIELRIVLLVLVLGVHFFSMEFDFAFVLLVIFLGVHFLPC